jgi:hypothetical protein
MTDLAFWNPNLAPAMSWQDTTALKFTSVPMDICGPIVTIPKLSPGIPMFAIGKSNFCSYLAFAFISIFRFYMSHKEPIAIFASCAMLALGLLVSSVSNISISHHEK